MEDAWRDAILNGNSSEMESLLADDYMAITPNGTLHVKGTDNCQTESGHTAL